VEVFRPKVAFPALSLEAFCGGLIVELTEEENSYTRINMGVAVVAHLETHLSFFVTHLYQCQGLGICTVIPAYLRPHARFLSLVPSAPRRSGFSIVKRIPTTSENRRQVLINCSCISLLLIQDDQLVLGVTQFSHSAIA
jgi:hypothetical protein